MNDFLAGEENAGKGFVSHFRYDRVKGFEDKDIIITPLESFFKGGEYIEDSEEVKQHDVLWNGSTSFHHRIRTR